MRHGLIIGMVVAFCVCDRPDLGPAPFQCAAGLCPMGYRCASGLCVAEGEPDPPQVIAFVGGGVAPPQPVWVSERRFAIVWTQDEFSRLGEPGMYSVNLDGSGLSTPRLLVPSNGEVAFAALYHPGSGRRVVAASVNGDKSGFVELRHQPPGDIGTVPPTVMRIRTETRVPPGFGFGAPSLTVHSDREVTLAYTFGSPPRVVADNLFCATVDLVSGAVDGGCRPGPEVTQGGFASEVTVAEGAGVRLFFWLDLSVRVWGTVRGNVVPSEDLPVLRLAHAAIVDDRVAASVLTTSPNGGPRTWGLAFAQLAGLGTLTVRRREPVGAIVPHLVAHGGAFKACTLGEAGELFVSTLSATDLAARSFTRVRRVSKAAIKSCRMAAAPDGTVAVAWQEQISTGASTFRVYAALLPP